MEQWYNSGRQDAASVSVSYLTAPVGTATTSLLERTGTWQTIAPLQVAAPSTATVIASRDGNATANRRVRQTTLTGVNLAPGQEIMIRWGYTLNNQRQRPERGRHRGDARNQRVLRQASRQPR